MLESWVREKHLRFEDELRRWIWDADIVHSQGPEGSDVQLMEQSFAALAEEAKGLLATAAVIGPSFGSQLLAEVCGYEPKETLRLLYAAEAEGIIGREDEGEEGSTDREKQYLFLHPHLHRLAYAHDAGRNAQRHWRVGKQLLSGVMEGADSTLMAAVDHLNRGIQGTPRQELEQLASYNLQASNKAVQNGQYAKGRYYAEAGLRFLGQAGTGAVEKISFHLKLDLACSLYGGGELEPARELLLGLMQLGERLSKTERLLLWQHLIQFHTLANHQIAVQYGNQALHEYGWQLKENPSLLSIAKEVAQTQLLLYRKRRNVQRSAVQQDAEYRTHCSLMLQLSFPMLLHNAGALIELYARFIRYGLNKGMNDLLAAIIVIYELLLQRVLPGYAQVSYFADSDNLMNMHASQPQSKYHFAFLRGMFKQLEHPAESEAYLRQSLHRGMKLGDNGFVNMAIITCLITYNGDLYKLAELLDSIAVYVRYYAIEKTMEIVGITGKFAAALRDASLQEAFIAIPGTASGEAEQSKEDNYSCCCRLQVAYLSARYEEALYWAKLARTNELASDWASVRRHRFYETMTISALYPKAGTAERKWIRQALRKQLKRMKKWRGIFGSQSAAHGLIEAEWKRIAGSPSEVIDAYWAAAKQAKTEKNGLMEGIICERLAHYYEHQLMSRAGAMIAMMDACTAYSLWGVNAKVTQIRTEHADLLRAMPEPIEVQPLQLNSSRERKSLLPPRRKQAEATATADGKFERILEQLPRFGINRDNWLESFLQAAIRQSGADYGLVLSVKEEGYAVVADPYPSRSAEQTQAYAQSVLRHTLLTNQPIVLYDALQSYFVKDAYIEARCTRSILCMPIVVPGEKAPFLLYLENRHVPGVFTKRDINVLELILARTIYLKMLEDEAATHKWSVTANASDTKAAAEAIEAGRPAQVHLRAQATAEVPPFIEPLTSREIEVLEAIAQGLSNKDIGERFGIAETTVKTHTTRIFGKLGVKRRGQAVVRAKEWNIIE
ncbi:LuxR C-terminal-related transcriptional regulator [Paenibacillus eucommiae]|uniref:DNA-binding CsgD family transcriptional regulator n=1 Tax=Paenibacillus eucommiae TaxID=1355755 RepID=A0ABS4J332_9BACL|nr:LuxR C-terminal-related transcriptional regulator [Paenibacillus eucommiae]MBP1994242.1 DNA-binding CsgD family transcriptional regulator [Paenibacillus eucommiae]